VVACDVDHFKAYNDAYGHPAGDACLRAVADVLRQAAAAHAGIAARLGGEEFALLLPGRDAARAHALAEAMRRAMEGLAIPHRGAPDGGVVTVSFGVAATTVDASPGPQALLAEADRALYQAKGRGRNCVVVADAA
jgi:diguanylate cyclase (GGDEF)-like protein